MADVVWYQNNASPAVTDTVTVNGAAQDLTGATVRFRARDPRNSTLVIDQAATVTTPATDGKVSYTPTLTDTSVSYEVPPLVAWWQVTLSGGAVQDTPEFNLFIRAHAQPATIALCTLSDVRQKLGITTDRSRDDEILENIVSASVAISSWTSRQFLPQETAVTRMFTCGPGSQGDDYIVDFSPWDVALTNPNSRVVTLNPEDAAPVILTAGTDYVLEPTNAPEGVYKRLRISYLRWLQSAFAVYFGYAQISVKADWGFPAVPQDVKRAAVNTVASWMSRAAAPGASDYIDTSGRGITPQADTNYGLPAGARNLLRQYRRSVM